MTYGNALELSGAKLVDASIGIHNVPGNFDGQFSKYQPQMATLWRFDEQHVRICGW